MGHIKKNYFLFGYVTLVNQTELRVFQQETCKIHSFNIYYAFTVCITGDKSQAEQTGNSHMKQPKTISNCITVECMFNTQGFQKQKLK